VPLKRLCELALIARRLESARAAVPRTPGPVSAVDAVIFWPAALSPVPAVPELSDSLAARATDLAAERFYTTVEPIRERSTEVWRDSTLTKEKRQQMVLCRAEPAPARCSELGFLGCSDGRDRSPRHGMEPFGRPLEATGGAAPRPVSQRGMAGNRWIAVFCQEWSSHLPRSLSFDRGGRLASSDDLRRYQD
jgi:hypothetical protein